MKETIIKSVTAFLCVVAICVTSFIAVGKYSDAMKEVAKYQPAASAGANVNGGTQGGDTVTPADGTVVDPAADGTDTTDLAGDTAAPADGTTAASGTATTKAGSTTTDPTKYTKDQVVNYYNTCLKNSYNQKVAITKTEQIKITVDKVTGGDLIKNIANSLASKYATANTETMSFANGKSTTQAGKTADTFTLPTKLVPAGAKTATVKKSGAGYEINITLVSEASTLTKFPTYNKQCSYPLDLASVDLSPAKVVQADLTYTGTTIKTIVDGNGRVTSNTAYMPLKGTGAGKAFGITLTADVHGSWNHTATFKY